MPQLRRRTRNTFPLSLKTLAPFGDGSLPAETSQGAQKQPAVTALFLPNRDTPLRSQADIQSLSRKRAACHVRENTGRWQ
jgi:hypothetical protein